MDVIVPGGAGKGGNTRWGKVVFCSGGARWCSVAARLVVLCSGEASGQ